MQESSPNFYDMACVIDDCSISRKAHAHLLKKKFPELEIKCFPNPDVGLVNIRHQLSKGKQVLLMLDIEMPHMTGLEIVKNLWNAYKDGSIEVIFISSSLEKYNDSPVLNGDLAIGKVKKPLTYKKLFDIFSFSKENALENAKNLSA